MTFAWRDYQDTTAEFFRRLGCTAEVEATVEGVRGEHKIDVLVTGVLHSIPFQWIVECKFWKTNIPKEKVLILQNIVQAVGADRGFLLSETGFQSGAIRVSRYSNITLSSLDDLKLEANAYLIRNETEEILQRRDRVYKRLQKLHKQTDTYISHFMMPMFKISFADLALDEGLADKFPTPYTVTPDGKRKIAYNWEDLVNKLRSLLDSAEAYATKYE